MNDKINYYQGTLNRKSIKLTLKVANSLAMVKHKITKK